MLLSVLCSLKKVVLACYQLNFSTHMTLCSDSKFSWVVAFKEFAHPAMERPSAMDNMGPRFFFAAAMFGFVFQMTSLITEKELKLRQVITLS